ncbi:ABC transporter permease [Nocardioides marmoriginsengisoli]|uniref:ABC transporter permease n=1 Tax=Nocardioides marmoriginsengisoli TaxID=661483 RepID=A0A3N0CK70_9ACTN|nr:ABC transporter permease [Nocardioides marmoriginsengisoli]RNL63333.1 ABC transporter permease [Nocardioides marmoriginsengisoli]
MNGVLDWFRDSEHWHGDYGVPVLLGQHFLLTVTAVLIASAVGFPVALWLGHRHRGGLLAINLTNIGRAVPIVAMLSLFSLSVFGSGYLGPYGRSGLATLVTLALFALPPIVTSTYTALVEVDADVVEAARGMGMSEVAVLRRVELPLAAPLIVSGLRLAVVQVWATATIAALVAGPGLGNIITRGYANNQTAEVVAGSLIVALVALLMEIGFVGLQRIVDPRPVTSH